MRNPDDYPEIPPQLTQDLRALYNVPFDVPPGRETIILSSAGAHFARRRRFQRIVRWSVAGASAAAALLAVVLWRPGQSTPSVPVAARSTTPIEMDRPARPVTILDAFALARQLKAGTHPAQAWDADHDGLVNERDVETLARAAVRLKGGTLQ